VLNLISMLYQDNQNLPQKIIVDYKTILNRFSKTLDFYAPEFPEIDNLQRKVQQIHFNIILADSHLNYLKKICRLLEQEDYTSPVVIKLRREFCQDFRKFENGNSVSQEKEIYF
jgi:hypothetical protein